jgi:hypothetical protein
LARRPVNVRSVVPLVARSGTHVRAEVVVRLCVAVGALAPALVRVQAVANSGLREQQARAGGLELELMA